MAVPDTNTFSLQDVKIEIEAGSGGTTNDLVTAFANALASGFDPLYEGSKDRLLNFRNYQHASPPTYGQVNSTTTSPTGQACSPGPEFPFTLDFYFDQNVGGVTGYRIGEGYTGATAQTLRIFSFTEVQKQYDPATFNEVDATVVANEVGTDSALLNFGVPVTVFPVDIDLTTRVNGSDLITDLEVDVIKRTNCPSISGLNTARVRSVQYAIIDSNGIAGPTLTVDFTHRRPMNTI